MIKLFTMLQKRKKKWEVTNLRKERHGRFVIGDGTSNGDELAFLNVFFKSDSFFDCCECTWIVTTAAGAGHGGELCYGEEWSVDAVVVTMVMMNGYRCCHKHLSTFLFFSNNAKLFILFYFTFYT